MQDILHWRAECLNREILQGVEEAINIALLGLVWTLTSKRF